MKSDQKFLTKFKSVFFWLTRQPVPIIDGRRKDEWVAGRMDILWPQSVLKMDPPFKDIRNCGKAESSSPLAIYKPHPEKIIFLHMPKGANKLCKYIAGSGPMFFFSTLIENFPALIEKSPEILNCKTYEIYL